MPSDMKRIEKLVELLKPLTSEQRQRDIATVLTFLGEARFAPSPPKLPNDSLADVGVSNISGVAGMAARMKQYCLALLWQICFGLRAAERSSAVRASL